MKAVIECHLEGKLILTEAKCEGNTTLDKFLEKEFLPKCSTACKRTVTLDQIKDVSILNGDKVPDWKQATLETLGDPAPDAPPVELLISVMTDDEVKAHTAAYEAKKAKIASILVQRGITEYSKGKMKDAWATFQNLLKHFPDNVDGLLYTIKIMCDTNIEVRLREALELAKNAEALYPNHCDMLVVIGDVNMKLCNYAAAEKVYNKAYEVLKPKFELVANASTLSRNKQQKGKNVKKGSKDAPLQKPKVDEGTVELYVKVINSEAEAALRAGRIDNAETILKRLVGIEQRDSTLTDLVRASIDHARSEKIFSKKPTLSYEYALRAMKTRLEAVVSHSGLNETKDGFNESLGSRFGLKTLYDALKGIDAKGRSAAASFSMLGLLGRDQGNLDQCIDLFKHGLALRPDFAHCALHVAHCYEALAQYNEAVRSHMDFFESNPELAVFTATCSNVLGVISPLRRMLTGTGRPAHPDMTIVPGTPKNFRIPPKGLPYPDDEISILGMYFTLAKYLYVMGYIQFIAPLAEIIHPLRENSDVHLTAVVNEGAYYGCVEKLAADIAPRLPLDTNCPTIYALGDSHTLAMGWNHVEAAGTRYLLKPYLVTGIKAYHLRPNTRFYPKETFWIMASSIPRGSYVVSVVGEIDCREAILSSIEKCGYKSIEEGVRETIRYYIPALLRLVREFDLRIMVHPAPPVQSKQLPVIKAFNETLRDRIAALKNPKIKYLDIADALVLDGWSEFNKKYALDGTHLRGNYVNEVLEPAINKAISEWEEGKAGNKK